MREEFDAQSKRDMDKRSQGICECDRMPPAIRSAFPIECLNTAKEYDHVYPEGLRREQDRGKKLTADDGAKLCTPCHKIKTALDKADIAKRERFTPRKKTKEKTVTRSRKIQSPGFDKRYKKKMNGEVIRRD
jgi:hypothetical protein